MGGIVLWGALADYATIKSCTIVGPGGTGVHQNTNGIYLKGVNHVKILNNEISNAPIGIYYKHANSATSADQAEIEIAFNYIYDTPRNAINSNSNFGHYHDNVMGANTGTSYFANANGVMGGNHNTLDHNTFFGGSFWVVDAIAPSFNILTNNVFRAELQLSKNKGTDHGSTLSFNVYPNANAIVSYDGIDVMDSNSKIGAPTFSGGGGAPATLDGYKLAATSVGFKASSTPDVDIGARIDLVGPAASGSSGDKAPSPPEGLSIQ